MCEKGEKGLGKVEGHFFHGWMVGTFFILIFFFFKAVNHTWL